MSKNIICTLCNKNIDGKDIAHANANLSKEGFSLGPVLYTCKDCYKPKTQDTMNQTLSNWYRNQDTVRIPPFTLILEGIQRPLKIGGVMIRPHPNPVMFYDADSNDWFSGDVFHVVGELKGEQNIYRGFHLTKLDNTNEWTFTKQGDSYTEPTWYYPSMESAMRAIDYSIRSGKYPKPGHFID